MHLEINLATGERIEVPLTPEEETISQANEIAAIAKEQADNQKEQQRRTKIQALLAKTRGGQNLTPPEMSEALTMLLERL